MMKVLITGATGTAGVDIVRTAIARPEISAVTAIVRSDTNLPFGPDPKLTIRVLKDYKDVASLELHKENYGAVLWCLGISQNEVTKEQYRVITYDYAVDTAKELLRAPTTPVFCFLSGRGTGPDAWTTFGKVKYETETELFKMFPEGKMYSFRPAMIQPSKRLRGPMYITALGVTLGPIFERFFPSVIAKSATIGDAMINAALYGSELKVLENMDIRNFATTGRPGSKPGSKPES